MRLARLHLVEQARQARIVGLGLDAEPSKLGKEIRASGLIRDQHCALVADAVGRNVFISSRVFGEGGSVNAGLGGEGRRPDIGRVAVRRAIEQFVEGARDRGDLAQRLSGDAGLETLRQRRLQSQRWDETDQIGVAAALAKTVQRALHLPRAGADGGERIGDRVAGVVMGVDAEIFAGD